MIKELNKKYFKNHPLKEISAARFEYSLYTMDGIEKLVNDALKDKLKSNLEDLKDEAAIESTVKPEELLKYMRKGISANNRQKLRDKILEYEAEMKPLIQRRAITNLQDIYIENTLYFFLHCKENCCDWIIQQYENIRSEYLKSMLCLVLGFRGDVSLIPFLMNEVERFERYYPDKDYEQGPLLALYELKERFGRS